MNNWSLILSIARTHLITKLRQTSIAALGVTFGITAYITLVCFMTGLNAMLDNLILNQTPHIHIYNEIKPSSKQPIQLYDEFIHSLNIIHSVKPKKTQKKIHNASPIIAHLLKDQKVKAALPRAETQIYYIAGSIEIGGNLTGILPEQEASFFNFNDYIIRGTARDLDQTDNGILIGAGIADKMSLKVGDRIQVSPIDGGLFPLKIVGIYQSGVAEIDAVQSFVHINTIHRVLGKANNYITDINVKLHDMDLAAAMAKRIEAQFNLRAVDIKTANAQFETGTSIRNLITYAVSVTLLIVAGFGIYNILNMLIYEKMNDIAILKATGFSGRDVQLVFMSQAMIIGFTGGILGLLLGFGLAHFISTIPFNTQALPTIKTYPINMNPWFFVIGFTFALVSTFLAGYLPANKARKIDPVNIIRGQ